jgi:microcompartment protein CcmL/EutN
MKLLYFTEESMKKLAAGFIEALGYSVVLDALDKACKSANITIEGIDCNNPALGDAAEIPNTFQAKITGEVEQVNIALENAKKSATKRLPEKDVLVHLIPGAESGIYKLLKTGKVKIREGEESPSPDALGIVDVQFYANAVHVLDIMSNCGAITCQFIGGVIVENYGGQGVYLFYGLLNVVGILIYLLFGLYKHQLRLR